MQAFVKSAGNWLKYTEGDDDQFLRKEQESLLNNFWLPAHRLLFVDRADVIPRVLLQGIQFDGKIVDAFDEKFVTMLADGTFHLYNMEGMLLRSLQPQFQSVSASLGLDGTLWFCRDKNIFGGFEVYWTQDFNTFHMIPAPAAAVQIAGASDGLLWTTNDRMEVWKLHRLGEGNTPGCQLNPACRGCLSKSYGDVVDMAILLDESFITLNASNQINHYEQVGSNNQFSFLNK